MSDNKHQLRVCSYNIHKGFSAANIRPMLQNLRHAIRTIDADLVFLQEVVGKRLPASVGRSQQDKNGVFTYPQFEYLADDVWPHHAYGRNAIYQRGHHGNAILSKNAFSEWDNVDVSQWWFSQRGLLFGRLNMGVYLVCIHFGLFARERQKQLHQLLQLLDEKVPADMPLIIAGDFNDWQGKLHQQMTDQFGFKEAYSERYGAPAKTFPARFPLLTMDRIYFRNLKLADTKVLKGLQWRRLSDHQPLYAEFDLP
jgi:endonuclease/exonuclease/phosphatase family metal-dependent hydrolase